MIFEFLRCRCRNGSYKTGVMLVVVGVLYAQQTGEKLVNVHDVEQITDAVLISNVSVAGKTVQCRLFIKPPAVVQPVTPFQAAAIGFST